MVPRLWFSLVFFILLSICQINCHMEEMLGWDDDLPQKPEDEDEENMMPDMTLITTVAKFKYFLSPNHPRVVGFFQNNLSTTAKAFFGATEKLSDSFKLGYVNSKSVFEELGYSDDEVVLFYPTSLKNDYEDDFIRFDGEINSTNIEEFAEEKQYSLVSVKKTALDSELTFPEEDKRFKVHFYFDIEFSNKKNREAVKETKYWYNKVLEVANKYKENPVVVFRACHTRAFMMEIGLMGFLDTDEPINVGIWGPGPYEMKYPFHGEFHELEEHLEKVLAGKAKPFQRSAKKPKKNKGPVKIVVGKTFKKIVNSKKKDVLIMFCAPWSNDCKNVSSVYLKLGTLFKKEKHITIAKIDAIANDWPGHIYPLNDYPTFYFAKKNLKDAPLKYEGEQDLDSFIEFLHKHSTSPITSVPLPKATKGEKKEIEIENNYKEEL